MVRVMGSFSSQSCPGDKYEPFEPSSSLLGYSQVAADPPWPQDQAARRPWSGLWGHSPAKAVQEIIKNHVRYLAAFQVTPKWLQTLPGLKMGLPGGHGLGKRVMDQPKLFRG